MFGPAIATRAAGLMTAALARRVLLFTVTVATTLAATLLSPDASAQRWLVDGELGVGAGLEGGNPGGGSAQWQMARLRIFGGTHLRVDETEYQAFGFRAFFEVQRTMSVGAEGRYVRWVNPRFGLFGGGTAVVFPKRLFGAGFGAEVLIPLGDSMHLLLEPAVYAAPLGNDLPKGEVLIWALASAGVRFGL